MRARRLTAAGLRRWRVEMGRALGVRDRQTGRRVPLSQGRLADLLGVTWARVSHLETGRRPIPAWLTRALLAEIAARLRGRDRQRAFNRAVILVMHRRAEYERRRLRLRLWARRPWRGRP